MTARSDITDILKTVYAPLIQEQLNNVSPLHDYYTKDTTPWEGNERYIPLHISRNTGIGARDEYGGSLSTLPAAGKQGHTKATYGVKYLYGSISVTGPAINAKKSDKGGWVDTLDMEMTGLKNDLVKDMNRILWGDGTGNLVVVGATEVCTASAIVTVTCTGSIAYLQEGMILQSVSYNDSAAQDGVVTISSIDEDNNVFYGTSGSTTFTVNTSDFFVRYGNYDREPSGLGNLIATSGTVGGIGRGTSTRYWKCRYHGNSGTNRDLTEDILKEALHDLKKKTPSDPSVMFTTYDILRKYANIALPMRRFNVSATAGESQKFDVGYSDTLDFNGIPIMPDDYAIPNKMFILDKKHLLYMVNKDWGWLDEDGDMLKQISNADAYQAWMGYYGQNGIDSGWVHALIADLAE